MADQNQPPDTGRPNRPGRPGRAAAARPDQRPAGQRRAAKGAADRRTGGKGAADRRAGGNRAGDRGTGGNRGADKPRSSDQKRYDGPPLEESITGNELSREIRAQLRGLPEKLAIRVARHLVAAGRLIEEDPHTAYQHTLAARARAARIAVVREACGEAAYAAGEYADALAELRAARRMTGRNEYLPVMADCERALGRPERALALARDAAGTDLDDGTRVEMAIVEAGARRDLGQPEAALAILEAAPLRSQSRAEWVVRLRYAYADALLAAGRRADALQWFHRTAGIDGARLTDAAERIEELEDAGPGPE